MRDLKSLRRCVLAGALLFTAACGGGADETAETVAPASTIAPTTAPVTSVPATTAAPTSVAATTQAPPVTTAPAEEPSTVGQVASGALELVKAGFSAFDDPHAVRISNTVSQTLVVPALGADSVSAPEEPTVIIETLPNGDSYTLMRVGQLFAPMASGDPALAEQIAAIELEIWIVGDVMTIDATDYQLIADLSPAVDLGPFAPGIGTIDLGQLGELGGPEVAALLVGSSIPDPAELGRTLPAALTSLGQDPADPSRFRGTATYNDVIEAQGGDSEQMALAGATGVAANFGIDARELAAFYADYYDRTQTEVEILLDASGALETMSTVADLSGIWEALFSDGSPVAAGAPSADDLEEARAQFAGSVWTVRSDTTFEIDDTIQIVPPAGEFEDRTQIAADFFEAALGG